MAYLAAHDADLFENAVAVQLVLTTSSQPNLDKFNRWKTSIVELYCRKQVYLKSTFCPGWALS